ncbi:MAG: Glycerate 3-kinase [Flavobacteriaceae bacterium]|jgi:glycerate kinase|nr:MAG: Glycerate 3-kinase [Flavobacteriaceae bacterium]
MQLLVVPDSFKESLSAKEVADAIARGIHSVNPEITVKQLPFSDGGEGALDLLQNLFEGELVTTSTIDAMGRSIKAPYFRFADRKAAWIELSQASGLAQIEVDQRNPMLASTYGTGLQIRHALDHGAEEIYLGIGGSATNDGGTGILSALGGLFSDAEGEMLLPGGGFLTELDHIDVEAIPQFQLKVACDVNNPLLGKQGATAVYGPQKGVTPEMEPPLEAGLTNFSKHIELLTQKSVAEVPGAGAAGGCAAGLHGLLGAELVSGFELLAELSQLEEQIAASDLIITAEGRIDGQSLEGKLPVGVAKLAKKHDKPVVVLAGSIGEHLDPLYALGIDAVFSIQSKPCTLEESISNASELLESTAQRVFKLYQTAKK